jgi:hypothetical protein
MSDYRPLKKDSLHIVIGELFTYLYKTCWIHTYFYKQDRTWIWTNRDIADWKQQRCGVCAELRNAQDGIKYKIGILGKI